MEFLRPASSSSQESGDTEVWSDCSSDNTGTSTDHYNRNIDEEETKLEKEETKEDEHVESRLNEEHIPSSGPLSQADQVQDQALLRGTEVDPVPNTTILAADILEAIDELGVCQPTLQPTAVWEIIRERFYRNINVLASGIKKSQVHGRFYRTKLKIFGNDIFVAIKTEPLCNVRENNGLKFFQYHGSYS
ncbi:hypothetical protein ON010_g13198 [Phytophthora cinnamomi]|nr:hypothetical protein ON010_g13198 [Phytophthora cinnamomi]